MNVRIKKIHPDAIIPEYKTEGAAGFDFHLVEDVQLNPGQMKLVRTGLAMEVPQNHVLLVFSRSSGPLKLGVTMGNDVGVIDSDYSGNDDEIFLILENVTNEEKKFSPGDRVAQGVIVPHIRAEFTQVDALGDKNRGGHGSTGK